MATANRVTILACGAMSADLTWLLLKRGRSIRDRRHRDVPTPWVELPTYCVLVETDDGTMLWDTSCPRDWEERWAPTGMHDFFPYDHVAEHEYLDSRLRRIGVGPDEIDHVVLSHLHFDHAGNIGMFENATLVCHEQELAYAHRHPGSGYVTADYAGCEFRTVSGDTAFLPGVTLIETPGHTAGTMSMQVDLADTGTMIFTSDAVYLAESFGPPAVPQAFVHDLEAFHASVEKLRGIQARTNAMMVFGHDAEQMKLLRVAPEGSYT